MKHLGYIITNTSYIARYGGRVFYHIRACEYIKPALLTGSIIDPTRHFTSYDAAQKYAEGYYRHLKLPQQWYYIGNMTNLGDIEYIQWKKQCAFGRWYTSGRYFTISKTHRAKLRKAKRTKK